MKMDLLVQESREFMDKESELLVANQVEQTAAECIFYDDALGADYLLSDKQYNFLKSGGLERIEHFFAEQEVSFFKIMDDIEAKSKESFTLIAENENLENTVEIYHYEDFRSAEKIQYDNQMKSLRYEFSKLLSIRIKMRSAVTIFEAQASLNKSKEATLFI